MATSPIPPMLIELQLETSKLQGQMQQLQGSFDNMGKTVEKSGSFMERFKAIAAGVFAGNVMTQGLQMLETGLHDAVKAIQETQVSTEQLSTALNNAGQNSAANREQIAKTTEKMGGLGFSVAATQGAYTKFVTATGSAEQATKLMTTAADLARYKHISLEEASGILTKGMMGNAKAFKEFGITLDTTLPKNQAIAKAMDELNGKIGGQAVGYTKTFAGQMEILKAKFDDVAVKVGMVVMPILTKLMQFISGVLVPAIVWLYDKTIGSWIAAIVKLWNTNEGFRKVMVEIIQTIVAAFGYLLGAVAKVIDTIAKVPVLGAPFKGLAGGIDKAAESVGKFAEGLDSLANKKIKVPSLSDALKNAGTTGTGGTLGVTGISGADAIAAAKAAAKQQAADLKKANAEVVKIYDEMNKAIDESSKKSAAALEKRDAAIVDTKAKYAKKELDIIAKKNDELAANEKKWNDAYKKAYATNEAEITKIKEAYEKKRADIESNYIDKGAALRAEAQKKIAEATATAAEEQAKIVQQSIDRLRNAFATGTAASISEIFKAGATSADQMLEQLKSKLQAAKELQKNAAALAAAGYSQTFIEDVVKNGPEIGNQMATALLSANDETKKQLQSLYGEVNNISSHGVDALAKTMNQGGKLATDELMAAYNQVPSDLAKTLSDINTQLTTDLASAQKEYNKQMEDAAATRDAAISDSKDKLVAALDAADQALAEANAQTMSNFNDAMAKNAADLADALATIQKDYEDAIAKIAEDTKAKLADLQASLEAVAATLAALGAAQASAAALSNAPTYTPPTAVVTTVPYDYSQGAGGGMQVTNNYNVPQTFVSPAANPADVHLATMTGIKYGNAITVNTSTLEGIMKASAAVSSTSTGTTSNNGGKGAMAI